MREAVSLFIYNNNSPFLKLLKKAENTFFDLHIAGYENIGFPKEIKRRSKLTLKKKL